MKTRFIYLVMAIFISTIMYSQQELHIYNAFASGTTENVLETELQKTYSIAVVDWDNNIFTLDGKSMEIGRYINVRDKDVIEFTTQKGREFLMMQLSPLHLLIKNDKGEAIIFIKYEEVK